MTVTVIKFVDTTCNMSSRLAFLRSTFTTVSLPRVTLAVTSTRGEELAGDFTLTIAPAASDVVISSCMSLLSVVCGTEMTNSMPLFPCIPSAKYNKMGIDYNKDRYCFPVNFINVKPVSIIN